MVLSAERLISRFDRLHDASDWVNAILVPNSEWEESLYSSTTLLYIHRCEIVAGYRGHRFGIVALDQLIRSFGGPTFTVLVASPHEGISKGPFAKRQNSLINHYGRAGFVSSSEHKSVMVRDPHSKQAKRWRAELARYQAAAARL
jgi:hypothetical protein